MTNTSISTFSTAGKKLAIGITFFTLILFSGFAAAAEMVNLNKASAAAIQQNLVGIGPIKAEAIVSYRKKNGKFKSLDDLQNVTGIGPALIKKNKRYLSLSKGAVSGDDKAYAAAKKQAGKGKSTATKKKTTTTAKPAKKSAKVKDKSKTTAKPAKKAAKSKTSKKPTKSTKPKKDTKAAKPAKKKPNKKKPTKKKKKKKTSKSTT